MVDINEMENWLQENNMFPVRGRSNGKFSMWERSILQWLNNNRDDHDFSTVYQVVAYLLGGQNKVYEVKGDDPHAVVWGTGLEEFFVVKTEYIQPENKAEVVIHHYDSKEEAEETAKALNDLL